jgi:predicted nucleic acid-binding protein
MSESVFLDTVGLLALWNKRDQWHERAKLAFKRLAESRRPLTTTPYVLLECGNAAARHPFRSSVVALREQLIANGALFDVEFEELEAAWQAYSSGECDQAGIVDQISFSVMRREGLRQAFSNDHHFQAAGFETLF